MHGSIESLALAVSLRMVWGRSTFLDPIQLAESLQQVSLEISPLIAMNALWDTEGIEPLLRQYPGYSTSLLVRSGVGLGELGKNVGDDQYIFSSVTCFIEHREVDGNYLPWLRGRQVSHEGSYFRLGGFRYHTTVAVLTVLFDISSHVWPKAPFLDQVCCPLDALMAMVVVKAPKDFALQGLWE